jgi:hypothetical protein
VDRLIRLGTGPLPRVANGLALLAVAGAAGLAASRAEVGTAGGLPVATVAAVILAAAFGWAALSKLARPSAWRDALRAHGLGGFELPVAVAVPMAELAVAASLLLVSARAGAAAALALLVAFSLALVRVRLRSGDRRVPCGCFGRRASVDVGLALVRNAVLAALGVLAFTGRQPDAPPLGVPSSGEAVPALLALVGLALGVWVSREVLRTRRSSGSSPGGRRSVVGSRP